MLCGEVSRPSCSGSDTGSSGGRDSQVPCGDSLSHLSWIPEVSFIVQQKGLFPAQPRPSIRGGKCGRAASGNPNLRDGPEERLNWRFEGSVAFLRYHFILSSYTMQDVKEKEKSRCFSSGCLWSLGLAGTLDLGSSAPSVSPESSSGRVPMSLPLLEALPEMVK